MGTGPHWQVQVGSERRGPYCPTSLSLRPILRAYGGAQEWGQGSAKGASSP